MQIAPEPSTSRAAAPRIASLVPSVTELLVGLGLRDHAGRAHRLLRAPGAGGRNGAEGRRHQGREPRQAAPPRADPRAASTSTRTGSRRCRRCAPGRAQNGPQLIVTHPLRARRRAGAGRTVARRASAPSARCGRALRRACSPSCAASSRQTLPDGRAPCQVLYLIWRDPWMTVARDTYISRMLGARELADDAGTLGRRARRGALPGAARRRGVARRRSQRVLLSSEPYRFDAAHLDDGAGAVPGAQRAARRWRAAQLVRRAHARRAALCAGARRLDAG